MLGSCPGGTATGVKQKGPVSHPQRQFLPVLNERNGRVLTIWGNPIELALVVLRTFVCVDLVVLLTEALATVLALEGKEVDQVAQRVSTLLSDVQHVLLALGSRC